MRVEIWDVDLWGFPKADGTGMRFHFHDEDNDFLETWERTRDPGELDRETPVIALAYPVDAFDLCR